MLDERTPKLGKWRDSNSESNQALSLLSLELIRQSIFELESGNQNIDGRTTGHQSNSRVGYMQVDVTHLIMVKSSTEHVQSFGLSSTVP